MKKKGLQRPLLSLSLSLSLSRSLLLSLKRLPANCMITKIARFEIIQSMTKPNYWQVIPCQL